MASGNTTKNVKYIKALGDFVNDVKPYHSKFTEIEESVYFSDSMNVKISEEGFKTAIRLNSVYTQNIFGNGAAKTVYGMATQLKRGRSEYGAGSRIYTVTSSEPQAAKDIVGLSTRHSSYYAPNSDGFLSVSVNQKIKQLGHSVFKSHGVISIDVDANSGNPQWRETLTPESYWKLSTTQTIQISPTATSQTWSLIKIDPIVTNKILFNGIGIGESTATSVNNQPSINLDIDSLIGATSQTWTLTAISTNTFNVVGSVSGTQPNATVGQFYDGQIKFTIPNSQYSYSVGNNFTFTVLGQQPSYLVYGSTTGMLAPATVGVPYDTTYEPATPISFTISAPIYRGPNGRTGTNFSYGNFDLTFDAPPRFDAEEEVFLIRAIDSGRCDVVSSLRGHLPGVVIGQPYVDKYVKFTLTGFPSPNEELRFAVVTERRLPKRFGQDVYIFGECQFSSTTSSLASLITNPGWGLFMNTYAVWNNGFVPEENTPYTFTGVFTASTAGTKLLQIAGDNSVKVYVNGNQVATTTNFISADEITVSFNSGSNILTFEVTNNPPEWDSLLNPIAFAAVIRDNISSPILWDTRSNPTYQIVGTTTTNRVTGISSVLHSTASAVQIKQYLNDVLYFKTAVSSSATTFTASSIIPIRFEGSPAPGDETKTTIKLLNPVNGEYTAGTLTLATNVLSLTNNFVNTFLPLNKPCTIEFEQQSNYVDRVSVKIVDQLVFTIDLPKANRLSFDDFLLATRSLGYDSLAYGESTPPFSVIYPPDISQNEGYEIIGITTSTFAPSHALYVAGNQVSVFSSLTNSVAIIADIPRSGLYGVTNAVFDGTSTAVVVNRPLTDANGTTDVIGKRIYVDRSLAVSRYDRHLEIILPDADLPLDNTDDISSAHMSEASIVYDLNFVSTSGGYDSVSYDSTPFDAGREIFGDVIISLPQSFNFADSADEELGLNPLFTYKTGCYAVVDRGSIGLSSVKLVNAKIDYRGETLTSMPKLYLLRNFSDTAPYELSLVNRFASSSWKSFSTTLPLGIEEPSFILVLVV